MAVANKMTALLNKMERRLGLAVLEPHLPEPLKKKNWHTIVEEESLVTFSRYFPHQIRFPVNERTCDKRREDSHMVYYIKDQYIEGLTLLGVKDIDWQDFSSDNISVAQTGGYGYYSPDYIGCPMCTFEEITGFQMMADMMSLYNRGIYLDFFYPNKIQITGSANTDINLEKFVVFLLVQHPSILTISPTMMNVFEELVQADLAGYIQKSLKYFDNLDSVYINIDLKLSDLENEAGKRDSVIEKLENASVSASNNAIPYIMTV